MLARISVIKNCIFILLLYKNQDVKEHEKKNRNTNKRKNKGAIKQHLFSSSTSITALQNNKHYTSTRLK